MNRRRRFAQLVVTAATVFAATTGAAHADVSRVQNCYGKTPTIAGTVGNDTIYGTAGADVIVGGLGNDTIYGLGGNDTICGNTGNDTVNGGAGNDYLFGGAGDDVVIGKGDNARDHVSCDDADNTGFDELTTDSATWDITLNSTCDLTSFV
jgi:Ca2+-binding RTX toxin-like protein